MMKKSAAIAAMAIVVGFAGVLLVLQPDASGFNVYGLLAVGVFVAGIGNGEGE